MDRRWWRWIGVMIWGGLAAAPAQAHMRDYLVSQPYYTAKRGEFEVEVLNNVNLPRRESDDTYHSTHQIEVEYGITDHLQVAYYEVYRWDRVDDWEREAFKIELKARLAEAGQWPVDLAFYAEYENPNGRRADFSDVLEHKVILSKDFGRLNLTGNFIFEKELNSGEAWQFEYTAGVNYAVAPTVRLGVEVKESLGGAGAFLHDLDQRELLIVPGIYANVGPHARVLFGPAFGVTRASDDLQLRSIVEVEF